MYKIITSISLVFFAFILWIIYQADTGQNSIFFNLAQKSPYGDKLGHFTLFGLLTLSINYITKFKYIQFGFINVLIGTFSVFVFVLIEELSQYFLPTRTFDVLDIFADIVGIIIFNFISSIFNKRKLLNT